MMHRIRAALLALVSLTLLSTVGVTAPAGAAPLNPTTQATVRPTGTSPTHGANLTAAQWKAAQLAAKARREAISPHGRSMDYTKMIKIFGTRDKWQVDWRRQMAAGYRQVGGKINGLSRSENDLVEKRRKELYGNRKPGATKTSSRGTVSAASCKGRSDTVIHGSYTNQYYNSCETIDLVHAWQKCTAVFGAIGFFGGKVNKIAWTAYIFGGYCANWADDVGKAAQKSDTGSIVVQTYKQVAYQPYNGGTMYYIEVRLIPQD